MLSGMNFISMSSSGEGILGRSRKCTRNMVLITALSLQLSGLFSQFSAGPIVRINPFELHINDPEYYDELYSGSSKKRDKYEWAARLFGNSGSMLGTIV
jgi:hypothetical protein